MAYVVARPQDRWEIRESRWTPRGPRSRTLASFTRLSSAVVDRARAAAAVPVAAERIWELARRAGAPAPPPADEAARTLLAELAAGRPPSPGLRRMLLQHLGAEPTRDPLGGGVVEWLTATPRQRGDALRDLLGLADHLPPPKPGPLRFPRLGPPAPPHG